MYYCPLESKCLRWCSISSCLGAAVVAGGVLGACQGTGASVVWAKIWSVIGWD